VKNRKEDDVGGSLKRSLGMARGVLTIPKAFGFEAATLHIKDPFFLYLRARNSHSSE